MNSFPALALRSCRASSFARRLSTSRASQSAVSVHYDVYFGSESRTPIVIGHAMLGWAVNWASMGHMISNLTGRSVITYDARNHGLSPHAEQMTYADLTEDVVALLRNINVKKAIFLGHSMGGRTFMNTALTHPDLVEKLIVVDISPVDREIDVTHPNCWNMLYLFDAMESVTFKQDEHHTVVRKDADKQLARKILDPMLRAWLLMNMDQNQKTGEYHWRPNVPVIKEEFKKHISHFIVPKTGNRTYNGPTLFIAGGNSQFILPEDHSAIKEMFPGAGIEVIAGAEHWVHSQKPKEFLQLVVNFINRS